MSRDPHTQPTGTGQAVTPPVCKYPYCNFELSGELYKSTMICILRLIKKGASGAGAPSDLANTSTAPGVSWTEVSY